MTIPAPHPQPPEALEPCPFCRRPSSAVTQESPRTGIVRADRLVWRVVCAGCGVSTKYYPTLAEAVDSWNHRTPPAPGSAAAAEVVLGALLTRGKIRGDHAGRVDMQELEAIASAALAPFFPAAPGWTTVTDDPATWPPDGDQQAPTLMYGVLVSGVEVSPRLVDDPRHYRHVSWAGLRWHPWPSTPEARP